MLKREVNIKPFIYAIAFGMLVMTVFIEKNTSALYVFAAALIHESGHIIAMKLCGIKIKGISLSGTGALIERRQSYISYIDEIIISLAGIIVNCITAVVSVLFGAQDVFVAANTALAAFNIIPVKGLDGYNTVRAVLYYANDNIEAAEKKLTLVSGVSLLFLWFAACFIQLKIGGSLSLLIIVLFMIIRTLK